MREPITIDRQEYEMMRARLQELEDIVHLRRVEAALASGETEALPIDTATRLIMGEPPLLVWREYRGLSRKTLVEITGLSPASIEAAETDPTSLSLADAAQLAPVLSLAIEDLAPASSE